ncbi:hypothetical protein CCP4SC76_7920016 [Gammaproteobacteria bacterium]
MILLTLMTLMAGCGHKGPLQVPDEPDDGVSAPSTAGGR